MLSFKDFVSGSGKKDSPQLRAHEKPNGESKLDHQIVQIEHFLPEQFSLAEKEKFGTEISALVQSESFVGELSKSIGKPDAHESEDEFVSRAKSALERLLRDKLFSNY